MGDIVGDIVTKQAYTVEATRTVLITAAEQHCERILTVIDDANVFLFVYHVFLFYIKYIFVCDFLCVNQCFNIYTQTAS